MSQLDTEWNANYLPGKDGVIVGCSHSQEAFLPWWWMNFRLYNKHPVTFVNFGDMSSEALLWCYQRGTVEELNFPMEIVKPKDAVDPASSMLWESMHTKLWTIRPEWFKKPSAFMKTPYERTVWLDVDCQVRGSIQPLFATCENEAGIAMSREADWQQSLNLRRNMIQPGQYVYNSGVISYRRHSPVMTELIKQVEEKNHQYFGDQHLLIHVLYASKLSFGTLSPLYNWTMDNGPNHKAVILHWVGRFKDVLLEQISTAQNSLFINLSFDVPSPNPCLE